MCGMIRDEYLADADEGYDEVSDTTYPSAQDDGHPSTHDHVVGFSGDELNAILALLAGSDDPTHRDIHETLAPAVAAKA